MRAPALLLAAALGLACGTAVAPPPPAQQTAAATAPEPPAGAFSADRAWAHLEALAAIGPRVSGSEGAALARAYLDGQLRSLGLEPRTLARALASADPEAADPPGEAISPGFEAQGFGSPDPGAGPAEPHSLVVELPADSPDLILLVAPYDSRAFESFDFLGANDGASGAAVLLELARVLTQRPLPYTTWLVFLDGEAERPDGTALRGSQALARGLVARDLHASVRLLVAVNQVCDADLRVARDLYSHRLYRNEFWAAAARLGHAERFESERFATPRASHWSFVNAGMPRVTALVDPSFGGDEPPGLYADTEDDRLEHCAAESLGVVGSVLLDGLATIGRRLVKIDRFSSQPLREPAPGEAVRPAEEPAPEAAEPAASEAASAAPEADI